jgi:hypothetical protein
MATNSTPSNITLEYLHLLVLPSRNKKKRDENKRERIAAAPEVSNPNKWGEGKHSKLRCLGFTSWRCSRAWFCSSFHATLLVKSRGRPEYKVTITGVSGLDLAAGDDDKRTPSPVFELTVRINNPDKVSNGCVHGQSTAVVSYGDAILGKGSVPPFCAKENQMSESERSATAWGQDLVVPMFLRERLAGELEREEVTLDVQVTMTADCYRCLDWVLVCKARIGGAPAPCRVDRVQRQRHDRPTL